jgi:hypothetical protein
MAAVEWRSDSGLVMREERGRKIAHVVVGAVPRPRAEGQERLLRGDHGVDQLLTSARTLSGRRITANAISHAEQARVQRQRLPAASLRLARFGEFQRPRRLCVTCAQQNGSAP